MRILLLAPGCTGICVEWTTGQLETEVESRLGIPVGQFQLQWQGRPLRDPSLLCDLSQVRVQFSLLGGYYSPEDAALSGKDLHKLICRKCYCRNSYDRRTCHKCGHPDLRSRKAVLNHRKKVSNPNRPK